jgi:hypothetical protein
MANDTNNSYWGAWNTGVASGQQGNPAPTQKPNQSWDSYVAETNGHAHGSAKKP